MSRLRVNTDFHCLHCGQYVSADSQLAGVHNRNHCPYCLWSRHLDLYQAGDRLAACKAEMRPVGLTLKRSLKKYTVQNGELMVIHQCIECGKLSINRIAADDFTDLLYEVYQSSRRMAPFIRRQLQSGGIQALRAADFEIVNARLYGRN